MNTFVFILSIIAMVAAAAAVIWSYKNYSELVKKVSHQSVVLHLYEKWHQDDSFIIDQQKSLIRDTHFRKVTFCSECEKGKWSEMLQSYLCGIEEKDDFDYCSEGIKKD